MTSNIDADSLSVVSFRKIIEVNIMAYEFTITDTFNKTENEILKEAMLIAKSEIEQQDLDPKLTIRLDEVQNKGRETIYNFSLVSEEGSNIDDEVLAELSKNSKGEGLAAAQA